MTDLSSQLHIAESKLAALHTELERLQEQVSIEEERVSLLRRLLELDAPSSPSSDGATMQPHARRMVAPRKALSLEDAVVDILSERTDAVHIGQIHSELRKRGVRIPGKGVDANIIARIIKEPRIEREAGHRGYYRLAHV
jgi:hypothetical protein